MVKEELCQGCFYKNDCQKVYEHLGKAEGPSVARGVTIAFLLPLVVFIAGLPVFEKVLAERIYVKELRTAISFLLALAVTFIFIWIIKVINDLLKTNNRNNEPQVTKNENCN